MKAEGQQTQTLWLDTASVPTYKKLDGNTEVDVCVIGAGIAGMTVAYQLARAGRRVLVLDDGTVGNGETGRTTAHITTALDDRYYAIESMHGSEGARLAAESHMAALNRAETIIREEGIDCDFRKVDGYLFAPDGVSREAFQRIVEKEVEATRHAGITNIEVVHKAPFSFWDTGTAIRFPEQAQFHPLKFLAALARCIERDGGRICGNTHVESVEGGSQVKVKTQDGHTVLAGAAAVCTNASISDYVQTHAKQAPYRTFVVTARVPRDSVPHGLYWTDADPYHYIRLQPGTDDSFDWLIVGGEDHKTGHKDDAEVRFAALETWTRSKFPMVEDFEHHWSGQVLEPFDYLAFTGQTPDGSENVYMHSGDSGNGITHGLMAGILLSALILKHDHPWARLYDPRRISLKAAAEFIKQNVDVAIQFRDYVRPAEAPSAAAIPPGEGRVLFRDNKRIAAYRDEAGKLHERSAVCTHLKCIVHWNTLEKSWDCPCHGSRFDPKGKVLNGPAISPLEEIE